ncbi:AMP-binding protein [Candidatus Riflebacteria bacterium]
MKHNIFSLLEEKHKTEQYRKKIALIDGEKKLSYGEIHDSSLKFAKFLFKKISGCKGARIGILLKKSWQETVSIFACAAAGNVFIPINNQLKKNQIEYIIKDCQIKVLVSSRALLDTKKLEFTDLPLIHVVFIDSIIEEFPLQASSLENILQEPEIKISLPVCIGSDLAAILYTSGSTGFPKGVILNHRNFLDGAEIVATYLKTDSQERNLSVLPFSFDYGLNQLFNTFLRGATLILVNVIFIKDLKKAVEKFRISVLALVPHLWAQLIDYLSKKNGKLETLKCCTNSGGHLNEKFCRLTREVFPNASFFLMYGLTESFRSTYLPPEFFDEKIDSIGKAVPGVEIMVINEKKEVCQPGEIGELIHRGALISQGYWGDKEKTDFVFRTFPFSESEIMLKEIVVCSGDLVKRDKDGFIYFVGRKDNIIKSMGFRISLLEIERKTREFQLIQDCVAIANPDPFKGNRLFLVASIVEKQENIEDKIISFLKAELPYYSIPEQIKIVSNFPLTHHGKIDRKKTFQMYFDEQS